MAYADLATIQTTDPGDILTAAWCDQARDNEEFLIDPPAVSVYNNAVQTIADNTLTKLNANSELFDNDSMHSTVSSNSRITCQTAGRYLVFATVAYDPNTSGERLLDFLVNNTTQYVGYAGAPNPSGASNTGLSIARAIILAAGDYVEARTRQKSTGNLDVTLHEFGAYFLTR